MTIKLYKKLMLANSIYYGHNYINCMDGYNQECNFQKAFINNFVNGSKSAEGENSFDERVYFNEKNLK